MKQKIKIQVIAIYLKHFAHHLDKISACTYFKKKRKEKKKVFVPENIWSLVIFNMLSSSRISPSGSCEPKQVIEQLLMHTM